MKNLKDAHPRIYKCFKVKAYQTVRRSDRYWADLWSDLITKQVMKRSLKTRGGITRIMHRRAGNHEAMITLTNMKRNTREQHVQLTSSRRRHNMK